MWLITKLGSLTFTIFICILLIVLLIISTTYESIYGTALAQKTIYNTKWFDLILSLLWINIFCSTVLRFPFKRRHIGFVVTHVGILGLLIGAMITRMVGIEGQMVLREGDTSKAIFTGGYQLHIQYPDGEQVKWPLTRSHVNLPSRNKDVQLAVGRILEHAGEQEVVREGDSSQRPNAAIKVSLKSEMMNMEEEFWLVDHSPANPHANFFTLGPAQFYLKKGETERTTVPKLKISDKDGNRLVSLSLTDEKLARVPLEGTDLAVENLQYFPHARVVNRTLVNAPQEAPYNPAVKFEIVDPAGKRQQFIRFAFFPEFESMHEMDSDASFDLAVEFHAPQGKRDALSETSSLTFYYWPDHRWTYEAISKDGSKQEGEVIKGEEIALNWLDMKLRADEILSHAKATMEVVEADKGPFAVELIVHDNNDHHVQWLVESQKMGFRSDEGDYRFALKANVVEVPFALTLNDFRKVDYPGTNNPASFESDVTLRDTQENLAMEKTISMNKPLDYKKYRIFQSSYMQKPGSRETSIFTVAKNPGITLIYSSSIVLFIGAFYQFYGGKGNNGQQGKQERN